MTTTGRKMIPYSDTAMEAMFAHVADIMLEHGLVEPQDDAEAFAADIMDLLHSQGHVNDLGDVSLGRFLLLPSQSPKLSLLLVSPLPTDPYDEELRRKPSPIQFSRTASDQILLPSRMLLTIIEELASNPVAPEDLRFICLNVSRRALPFPDIVLPPEVETVALPTEQQDIVEALVPGCILTVNLEMKA
ncbi:MAG: hypothetical protein JSR29_04565 [Nitrospira sp.]|nr:hypothetical protein [Nitrospira sp.]